MTGWMRGKSERLARQEGQRSATWVSRRSKGRAGEWAGIGDGWRWTGTGPARRVGGTVYG